MSEGMRYFCSNVMFVLVRRNDELYVREYGLVEFYDGRFFEKLRL